MCYSYCFDVATLLYIIHTHFTQVCICRLVTNNLCVSTWTGTEEYCRAEAMGLIIGVLDSTIVETKQQIY